MTLDDPTLYGRNDDDADEYGDAGAYGDLEEDYEEEEEEEAEEPVTGG